MKKHILLLNLLVSVVSFSQKESGSIEYKISPILFETNSKASTNPLVNEVRKIAESQIFNLEFNELYAKFSKKENLIPQDEIDESIAKLASVTFTTDDEFYLDINSKIEIIKKSDGALIEIKNQKEWEITAETKKIGDYKCYKAIYQLPIINRNGVAKNVPIVAWFAPNLPFSYGPKGYNGVPGLILELTERKTTYQATSISLNAIEKIKINLPSGKRITEEDYIKKTSQN